MQIVIRYGGIVILDKSLEPGEYLIGRGAGCHIRLHEAMLSRRAARIFFADDVWWFEDLRPSASGGRTPFTGASHISLGNNLEIVGAELVEKETTRSDHLTDIKAAMRVAGTRDLSMTTKLAILFALLVLGVGAGGGFLYWQGMQPMDANALLAFAKPRIVEFELPRETKGQADLRKYAELKDEDFTDTLGFCTGFIVDKGIVATANHCVQGTVPFGVFGAFKLKTHDGKHHEVKRILGFDIKRDYAFLEVPSLEAYGAFEITEDFTVGGKVYTLGNVAGEGVAIRDGIMANKTPDQDDPSVEFLRYSAAASPGNSGGPLVDGFGRVVALVFARASLSENYNLGTSGKDLREAKKRFVDDRNAKKVTIRVKDIMQFRGESLFHYLRIPSDMSWRENPESLRPLDAIQAEIEVPAEPAAFTAAVVATMNGATLSAYEQIVSANKASGGDWSAFLDSKRPAIAPAQFFGDAYYDLPGSPDGKTLKTTAGILQPPCSCILRPKSESEGAETEAEPFRAEQVSTEVNNEKRTLSMYSYRPLVNLAPSLDTPAIMKLVTGKEGLIASTASQYVRPKSQREFTIKELSEELKEEAIVDDLGRTWQVRTFELFDQYAIESYCLPLPEGHLCLTSNAAMTSPDLVAAGRKNFARFSLSPYLVAPTFWTTEKLTAYFESGQHKSDPMMQDFKIEKSAAGDLVVTMQSLGVSFTHPADDLPAQLRLTAALVKSPQGLPVWKAISHQIFLPDDGEPRVCDYGVEIPDSATVPMIHNARRQEQMMKTMLKKDKNDDTKIRLADVKVPEDKFFVAPAARDGEKFNVFGYCIPLHKTSTTATERLYEVGSYEVKPSKIPYKVF